MANGLQSNGNGGSTRSAGKPMAVPGRAHGIRFTYEQNLARKLKQALPKKFTGEEGGRIMWVLLNVMALTGKAIGLTDQEIVYIANRATKEILYGKEGSAVSGVRQEDLPVINFSGQGGDGDEALPVLPVPGVSQEKGEPVQD